MSDWKELEIGNIPSDFFVNKRYEIRNRWKENEWYPSDFSEIGKRGQIIIEMQKEKYYDYQYRLKPLEPIRITRSFHDTFMYNYRVDENVDSIENGVLKIYNGRPVEIKEE